MRDIRTSLGLGNLNGGVRAKISCVPYDELGLCERMGYVAVHDSEVLPAKDGYDRSGNDARGHTHVKADSSLRTLRFEI